jgi:hypothetical protein
MGGEVNSLQVKIHRLCCRLGQDIQLPEQIRTRYEVSTGQKYTRHRHGQMYGGGVNFLVLVDIGYGKINQKI